MDGTGAKDKATSMENCKDEDLEKGQEASINIDLSGVPSLHAAEDGDELIDMPPGRNAYDPEDEFGLNETPSAESAVTIPLRDEREEEDDQEWLLPGPRWMGRASTFPRITYERIVSP